MLFRSPVTLDADSIINAGGFSAFLHSGDDVLLQHRPPASALNKVPEQAVVLLFGPLRTARLRLPPDASATFTQKFGAHIKVTKQLTTAGVPIPKDYEPVMHFFYFQIDHHATLRRPDLDRSLLETWAFGFGRWSIYQADDPCGGTDLQRLIQDGLALDGELSSAWARCQASPGMPIYATLRSRLTQLMVRFSDFRRERTNAIVALALRSPTVSMHHASFILIRDTFAHDYRSQGHLGAARSGSPRLRRMASRFIDRLAISCRRGASPARMGRLTPTVKGGGVPARHVASAYVLACLGGESRRTTSPRRGCPSRVTRGGPRAESRDPRSRPLPPVSAVTR